MQVALPHITCAAILLLPGLARPVNDYIIVEKLFIIVDLGTMQRL
jgi:hypothetical protein